MVEKYRNKDFVVLAVNIVGSEDRQVAPLLKNNGFAFIPLKGSGVAWEKSAYKVLGAPYNFLIDASGRIVFEPKVASDEDERTLELEIEALLRSVTPGRVP